MNIYKNFLDNTFFNLLYNSVNSNEFPWFYRDKFIRGKKSPPYFTHSFYNKKVNSSAYESLIKPILEKLNYKKVIEVRANMILKYSKHFQSAFHIDYKDCKTAILYLNNCNGYTVVDNKKIKCERNKIVVFDSNTLHSGVSQTDKDKRMVLNINYYD